MTVQKVIHTFEYHSLGAYEVETKSINSQFPSSHTSIFEAPEWIPFGFIIMWTVVWKMQTLSCWPLPIWRQITTFSGLWNLLVKWPHEKVTNNHYTHWPHFSRGLKMVAILGYTMMRWPVFLYAGTQVFTNICPW